MGKTKSVIIAAILALAASARGGYWRADFNLDGVVDSNDLVLLQANMGRKSSVPNPEVALTSVLRVTPDRKTILQAETTQLSADNSNTIHWTFIQNGSGGSLLTNSSSMAEHLAGANSSTVDVIQAWDAFNNVGRCYLNVIGSNEVAALGKAIIIAGGKSLDDPVWLATDYLGNKGYDVLRYRGFSRENIDYLNLQPGRDIDGNGQADDIDGPTTLAGASAAFTGWAAHANKLFVYLVDHGSEASGQGYFRLNGGEILSATNLSAWLDNIQNNYGTEVTLVMDFCYAGTFLPALSYTGAPRRVVMAATSSGELTYFIAGGLISFSDALWSGLLQGLDIAAAFQFAQGAMSLYQHAQIDDDGDGIFQSGVDGNASTGRYVGATFVAGKNFPIIGQVLGPQILTGDSQVTLYASDIASYYPIENVWCAIVPPNYSPATNNGIPVVDIAQVPLSYNYQSGRYQAYFDGFTESGTYEINYYAKDIWQSVSPPKPSQVIQAGFVDKLLVLAGGQTNDPLWSSIRYLSEQAFVTSRTRAFTTNRLAFLSAQAIDDADHDGTNDVTDLATLDAVANVMTNWATDADRLTVYLVGGASNGTYRLNDNETLGAGQLDAWLDQLQASNIAVNVVMEFDGCGGYLPAMNSPADRERMTIACASAGQPVQWGYDGYFSFSQCFLNLVFQGESIGDAFTEAKTAIRNASGRLRQAALLDETGDGVPESKLSANAPSRRRHWGPAFVTGDDKPMIGTRMPDAIVSAPTSCVIWVADALDVSGITNVWCVVTPPDSWGTNGLFVRPLAFDGEDARYEAALAVDEPGAYTLTFYAQNGAGELSAPVQASILSADAYESDDAAESASYLDVGDTQSNHNFHAAADEDWIRFYVPATGQVFTIRALQQGTNIDLALDLYYEQPDGSLSNIESAVDEYGDGIDESEEIQLNFVTDPSLPEGFYLARVYSAVPDMWGSGSDYDFSVTIPSGGGKLIVVAVDKLNPTQSPVGAVATIDGGMASNFNGSTSVSYANLPAGTHQVRVTTAPGYLPSQDPALPNQSDNPANALYGNPKTKSVAESSSQVLTFQFTPHLRAVGDVQDAWTGEKVAGAKIEFTARSGLISNLVYDGYPNNATYESLWFTLADGRFPTNVLLPAVSYDLKLSKAGYSNLLQAGALTSPMRGTTNNLGLRLLTPLDTNGNAIADSWETLYFGGPAGAGADDDGDGFDNRTEYLLGTDPTNALSRFAGDHLDVTNGLTLRWPVADGRAYRVMSLDGPITGGWSFAAGPWTAAVGQASMQWTDSSPTSSQRFYRIDVQTR